MSEIDKIKKVVADTALRRRFQNGWMGLGRGLLTGVLLWFLAEVAYKLAPIPDSVPTFAQMAMILLGVVGFAVGWVRPVTLIETARWIDGREQLQERLSTALEVGEKESSGLWAKLVVADAASRTAAIQPRKLLPYHLPRAARWVVLVLAVGFGIGFVPAYRTSEFAQKKKDEENIKETGRQLADLTRRSIAQRPPALEPTRKALESVAELGDHLAKASLTRSEALKDLANVTDKLKEQARELGKNPAFKSMEKANQSSHKGGTPGSAEMQKQMEAMRQSLGGAENADSKAMEKFKESLQKAVEAAAGLPDAASKEGQQARQQLNEALANLAQQAKDMGLQLPSLDDAISALASSKTDQMLRDLKIAENDLEKLQQMAKALAEMQKNAEKVGKDLEEQLKNGQAEIAQTTLEKMIQKLKEGGMTAEDMKKLQDEVARSVKPGSLYGKAGEFLQKAASQMKAGEKGAASQSLADASKELSAVLQQLQDAQAMMASLEALKAAQVATANGMGWSGSKGPPAAGKGGGMGSGVGTWADDSRMMDLSDIKDRWDNSGVVRPDDDARGHTDRGDGQLADNLAPTKVKGQMAPGAPMPSITLKGVSIKGVSRVDFKEMSAAAQSDAQSALSQDQVPRAYQGAVRDYFDDLKK